MTLARCLFCTLVLAFGCSSPSGHDHDDGPSAGADGFGVLVMAHGGADEWNEGVLAAVKPLQADSTIEVAFGMADAVSIQAALERLEARGAKKIAVVRLFISGESWYERTQQILGVRAGAPKRPAPKPHNHATDHGGHSMEFWKATSHASFTLSKPGLSEASEMGDVLLARARALSSDPKQEDVLILAHGPGDDAENERWIARVDARAKTVRGGLPFRRVEVMTLREDWPEKRVEAERRIRAFVTRASAEKGTAIVIPFRIHGFGPYADVLDGLEYKSSGLGLIPHEGVTRWIAAQIKTLKNGPFEPQIK